MGSDKVKVRRRRGEQMEKVIPASGRFLSLWALATLLSVLSRSASAVSGYTFQGNQLVKHEYRTNGATNSVLDTRSSYYGFQQLAAAELNLTFVHGLEGRCREFCGQQEPHGNREPCVNQGCKNWKSGLKLGCSKVCEDLKDFRDLRGCQLGCKNVTEDYYSRVQGLLGTPDPPTLTFKKSTSLQLSWDGSSSGLPYLAFIIQKRAYRRSQQWENIPTEPLNQTAFTVRGLQPYTEYQFRLGWILAQDLSPIYSSESLVIETQPEGRPNAPQITSVQCMSNTSVSVTWIPPSQPNGPLIAYALRLRASPLEQPIVKEIRMQHDPRGYTFTGLSPNTNYSLSLSARNVEGEGEPTTKEFSTPPPPTSQETDKPPETKPKLLLQGGHRVLVQEVDEITGRGTVVFVSQENVTAIAAHLKNKYLFIATGDYNITRKSLDGNETKHLVPGGGSDIVISFLSVDWLHDKLYILGRLKVKGTVSNNWVIRRCNLEGENLEHHYSAGIGPEPMDFAANPLTGYLYWIMSRNEHSAGGLWKLGMHSSDDKPVQVELRVAADEALGPFTLDYKNYRILVVDKKNNTVWSINLAGDATDIRKNTPSPKFRDVMSIGTHKGLFYWTTGQKVGVEQYNSRLAIYFHNSFELSKRDQPFRRILVLHPDNQPVPVPLAPPLSPQAVFGTRGAVLSWQPPAVIAGLGDGAWMSWKYQVKLADSEELTNITSTSIKVSNLYPNTSYGFQVRAYSSFGSGPWSSVFGGRTLPEVPEGINIVWTSKNGLFSTDGMGEKTETLLASDVWVRKEQQNVSSSELWLVSSVPYNSSSMYLLLSNGAVYMDDRDSANSRSLRRAGGVGYAQTIAYDYVGKKLYWSDPKERAILRCGFKQCLDETEKGELIPLWTIVSEIVLDSVRAIMVWSTGHNLEMARLNGSQRSTLYQAGLFSGVRIVGLTIDIEKSLLYFATRSSEGYSLQIIDYTAKTSRSRQPITIAAFQDHMAGPLRFFQNRLVWLQDPHVAMFYDLETNSTATLRLDSIRNVTGFHVHDLSSWKYPRGLTKDTARVVPDRIDHWQVRIDEERSDQYVLRWPKVSNVNVGNISYSISITALANNSTITYTRNENFLPISNTQFKPHSTIEVQIVTMSYWASSVPTSLNMTTPAGKPSQPLNPRVYVQKLSPFYHRVYKLSQPGLAAISAEMRFSKPASANGEILSYSTRCFKSGVKSQCTAMCDKEKLTCNIQRLEPRTSYKFAVQGVTRAGAGNYSTEVSVDTSYGHNPVPLMLVSTADKLSVLDLDRKSFEPIFTGAARPTSPAYFALEKTVFWISEGHEIMKLKLDTMTKQRVISLDNQQNASNLALDWISRKLFWSSELKASGKGADDSFAIFSLDLAAVEEPTPVMIVPSNSAVTGITVNPFQGQVLWTTSKVRGVISSFVAFLNGTSASPFLSKDLINCNCSQFSSIGEPLAFDPYGYKAIPRGIIFTSRSNLYLADENGCQCVLLANSNIRNTYGTHAQPFKIVADQHRVYWSGRYLSAAEKYTRGSITELIPDEVLEVALMAPDTQPFPDVNCLLPSNLVPPAPTLLQHSSHSLNISLPNITLDGCIHHQISMPSPKYKVFYGKVSENGISECTPSNVPSCHVLVTSNSFLSITDLSPFTQYTVFVNVTNVYAELEGHLPIALPPIMLQTAAGAPMPPQLLRIERLTPSSIRVVWRRPLKLNGERVWYEVHWQPEKRLVSPGPGYMEIEAKGGQNWSDIASKSNENRTEFHLTVPDLVPGANYYVWVYAFSEKGDAQSASENKTVTTYENPKNLTLIRATPYSLSFQWIPPKENRIKRHQFVYRMGWETEWNETEIIRNTQAKASYNFTINGLKPKTVYGFKIRTWFEHDLDTVYEWPRDGVGYGQFQFETLADKPGQPGVPLPKGVGSMYEVSWERADPNGAQVELYKLECRYNSPVSNEVLDALDHGIIEIANDLEDGTNAHRSKRNSADLFEETKGRYHTSHWFAVYNGTEPSWHVNGIDVKAQVSFRVRAFNKYGWGDYSNETLSFSFESLRHLSPEPQYAGIVIVAPVFIAIMILGLVGYFMFSYKNKLKEKHGLHSTSSERREVELATLQELPGATIHQSNILYAINEVLLDLGTAGVSQISRSQICRTKFLGCGAFGEVHEGIVVNLPNSDRERTRVAIKSLRKEALPSEKVDFLHEAKLMTQLRHPHILQLMGICVDGGPTCLLLELMNGGDLLSYLRINRPHLGSSVKLSILDLLHMCLDVVNGCVYLEGMHFVHRDLAARNCLVRILETTTDDNNADVEGRPGIHRIVKIGDFGLSRDVYRNDYYKKDSAAPVPVRWMAPESLVDGIYTTQSDVWAFGVLVWEIMTLGNQPYPGRSNSEVLNYVSGGGQLTPPSHCPQRLTALMLSCWKYFPGVRPTFTECKQELEGILADFRSTVSTNSVSNFPTVELNDVDLQQFGNYLQPGSGSDTKSSHSPREGTGEGTELSTITASHGRERQPLYRPLLPKYLEFKTGSFAHSIFAPDAEPDLDDGYEKPLPKKPPRNPNLAATREIFKREQELAHAEIGLPPPPQAPYYNTQGPKVNYPVYNRPTPSTSGLPKSQLYLHCRKLGIIGDVPFEEGLAPLRNLAAATGLDFIDGDISDAELEPPPYPGSQQNGASGYAIGIPDPQGRPQVASLSDSGVGSAPEANGCCSQEDDEDEEDADYERYAHKSLPVLSPLDLYYGSSCGLPPLTQHYHPQSTSSSALNYHPSTSMAPPPSRYFSNHSYLLAEPSTSSTSTLCYSDRRKPVVLPDNVSIRASNPAALSLHSLVCSNDQLAALQPFSLSSG